jgi:hypothetical protein
MSVHENERLLLAVRVALVLADLNFPATLCAKGFPFFSLISAMGSFRPIIFAVLLSYGASGSEQESGGQM